jgi:hypothetical protein
MANEITVYDAKAARAQRKTDLQNGLIEVLKSGIEQAGIVGTEFVKAAPIILTNPLFQIVASYAIIELLGTYQVTKYQHIQAYSSAEKIYIDAYRPYKAPLLSEGAQGTLEGIVAGHTILDDLLGSEGGGWIASILSLIKGFA